MVSYAVKEIFLTLQGEGAQAGRVAVFCRFSGCNLWSGREEDRERHPAQRAQPRAHGRQHPRRLALGRDRRLAARNG